MLVTSKAPFAAETLATEELKGLRKPSTWVSSAAE